MFSQKYVGPEHLYKMFGVQAIVHWTDNKGNLMCQPQMPMGSLCIHRSVIHWSSMPKHTKRKMPVRQALGKVVTLCFRV